MIYFILSVLTQCATFLPLALGISISYHVLKATDMTLDGSFVLGAVVFSLLVTNNYSPYLATLAAMSCGALSGAGVASIQRGGKVDPLLAGVLATFILSSINLVLMGKPNISLLGSTTLYSSVLAENEYLAAGLICLTVACISIISFRLLKSHFGLNLRAFGDNPNLFKRLGKANEIYRITGFALTNALAAISGCLTAQTIGYADIGMGFGMTLTGIGAIILGRQILSRFTLPMGNGKELAACLIGILIYFVALNGLLKLDLNPTYLKLMLGLVLILFLRAAKTRNEVGT